MIVKQAESRGSDCLQSVKEYVQQGADKRAAVELEG